MQMLRFGGALALATAFAAVPVVALSNEASAATDDPKVTVTGCIVKGEEGGFLVADLGSRTSSASPPATVGTSGRAARVLYLLKDDDDWKDHAGDRVELTGEIEGDVEEGEIEVERKDNGIEIEIKADGKKVKALLPAWTSAVVSETPVTKTEVETKYLVHKIDVKSVKMLGDCNAR